MKLEAWAVGITAGSGEEPGRKGLWQETSISYNNNNDDDNDNNNDDNSNNDKLVFNNNNDNNNDDNCNNNKRIFNNNNNNFMEQWNGWMGHLPLLSSLWY